MAKSKSKSAPASIGGDRDDWEAEDAMRTLMRADEIKGNEALMKRVQKKAADHAKKSADIAQRAASLARRGLISDSQMSKMSDKAATMEKGQGGNVKDLDKTAPVA